MSQLDNILNDVLNELYSEPLKVSSSGNISEKNEMQFLTTSSMHIPFHSGYLKSWQHLNKCSCISIIENNRNVFKIDLNVQEFNPEEINVRIIRNYIVIDGNHNEREDEYGFVSRQFSRRYKVPVDVITDDLISTLSSDGILTIIAPKEPKLGYERNISIIRTNEPALKGVKNSDRFENVIHNITCG